MTETLHQTNRISPHRVAKYFLEFHKSRLNFYLDPSVRVSNKAIWEYFGIILLDLSNVFQINNSTLSPIYDRLKLKLTNIRIKIDREVSYIEFPKYIRDATKILDGEILNFPSEINGVKI